MSTPVIVYIHPDDQSERQQKAILGHCAEHDLEILGSVATPEAAAQAVGGGISSVVIAATDPRNGLRSQVVAAGGEVRFVRERSRIPTLRDFLSRAVKGGRTPSDIARAIGSETSEISELLKRLGLRKPTDQP